MKRGLNLQLALISLENIADDAENKTLSEIILFIVNTSKRIMVLDETLANQQDKKHLLSLENELLEKVKQSIRSQQTPKKQLAHLSPETQGNQRILEHQVAQKHLQMLESQLTKERQQAKERQVALILKGLAFALLSYLNEIQHPMIKDVIAHLAFKKVSGKRLMQAYNALIQLREELRAGSHQSFLADMTSRWVGTLYQNESILQLMHILNALTPLSELTPNKLPPADADFPTKNLLEQSNIQLKLNSSFIDLKNEILSAANSTRIYYDENIAYPLNSSASINSPIDFRVNPIDQKDDEKVNHVSIHEVINHSSLEEAAAYNTKVCVQEIENSTSDLNLSKIQSVTGSRFIYYNNTRACHQLN